MAAVAIVMRCKAIGKFLAVMVGQAHVSASESQARIVKDFFSTLTDVKIDDLAAIGEAIEDAGFASADKEMLLGELSGMAQLPLQITPVGMRRNRSMQDYEAACSYGKQSQWVAWRQAPGTCRIGIIDLMVALQLRNASEPTSQLLAALVTHLENGFTNSMTLPSSTLRSTYNDIKRLLKQRGQWGNRRRH